jgi:hypothetical protein
MREITKISFEIFGRVGINECDRRMWDELVGVRKDPVADL